MRALLALALATALPCLSLPGAAVAGPVDLRTDIATQGDKVTLGDLFYQAGAAAGVVIAHPQPGQGVVLDAGKVQVIAHQRGLEWSNPAGLSRIIVEAGGPAAAPQAAAREARPKARAVQTLAYLHSLNAGDIVRAEDLTWSSEAVASGDAPRDADTVIGMAARRPLREGTAVSLRDVSAPQVIKKDDVISVIFNMGGVNLTLQAKALDNAVTGAPVTVINPQSKKVIQAVATGPGQAVVGPEAEQIKVASRFPASRLALR